MDPMLDWFRRLIFGTETFKALKSLPEAMTLLRLSTITTKKKPTTLSELDKAQRKIDGIKLGNLKNQIRSLQEALLDQGGSVEGEEVSEDLQGFSIENLLNNPAIQKKILEFAEDPKKMERLKQVIGGKQEKEDWI